MRTPVLVAVTTLALAAACGPAPEASPAEAPATQAAALTAPGALRYYAPGAAVPEAELMSLGSPEDLGGTTLEGPVRISARIDYAQGPATAGVFQATRGKVRIVFPFDEHATILHGTVALTDATGVRHILHPGESYFVRQGSVVLWEVEGPFVQKSFFNVVTTP